MFFIISATGNVLYFTGKNPSLTDIILLLSQEVFFLSQAVFLVIWVYCQAQFQLASQVTS